MLPRSYDRALAVIVDKAELPRLTSHGLRHTAATHMVQSANDVGELRAIADILGHSPEILMNIYAHALPQFAVGGRRSDRSAWARNERRESQELDTGRATREEADERIGARRLQT